MKKLKQRALIAALVIWLAGCTDIKELQTNIPENHVIGILLVKEDESLPEEYEMSSRDIAVRRASLYLAYDPDKNNKIQTCGEPFMIGNDTNLTVDQYRTERVLHPIWAVSQYSDITHMQVWLIYSDHDRVYAVNSNKILTKNGDAYHFSDDYGLTINAELITIDVLNEQLDTVFYEDDSQGEHLRKYVAYYGNATEHERYQTLENAALVTVTGTVRMNETDDWTDMISMDKDSDFMALVENKVDGFLQCQKWSVNFAK